MQKIQTIKLTVVVLLTSALVVAGYEMRAKGLTFWGLPEYVVAGMSVLLGGTLATVLTNAFLSVRGVRRAVAGRTHVEGHWYIVTDSEPNSLLNPDGILLLSLEPASGEMLVRTTRLDEAGKEYTTASQVAYVRALPNDLRYLNYFKLPGPGASFGLSSGQFLSSDDEQIFPNRLEAVVSLTGDGAVRRQNAQKISDSRVKQLRRQYKDRWITVALTKGQRFVFEGDLPE